MMRRKYKILLLFGISILLYVMCPPLVKQYFKYHQSRELSQEWEYLLKYVKPVGKCTVYMGPPNPIESFSSHRLTLSVSGSKVRMYTYGLWDFISREIAIWGTFEDWQMKLTERLLRDFPELNFIDVGANLGLYTLVAGHWGRHVVAVEPLLSNVVRLSSSLAANEMSKRVTLVWNAVDDKRGDMELWLNPDNMGGSSARRGFHSLEKTVQSILLDDLLPVINFETAIMKIDIENSETAALKHASRLFTNVDIPVVFMEWGLKSLEYEMGTKTIVEFFKEREYSPFGFKEGFKKLSWNTAYWPYDIVWIRGAKYERSFV